MKRPFLWTIILMTGALIFWANNSDMDLYDIQGTSVLFNDAFSYVLISTCQHDLNSWRERPSYP
jgi:hypothetical protein